MPASNEIYAALLENLLDATLNGRHEEAMRFAELADNPMELAALLMDEPEEEEPEGLAEAQEELVTEPDMEEGEAATHEALDEAILGLWRQKKIGLEGISDLSQASQEQLRDGIQPWGEGRTILFYLEKPQGQPVKPSQPVKQPKKSGGAK